MKNQLLSMVQALLYDELKQNNFSRAELADMVRVGHATIYRILGGHIKSLHTDRVDKILDILGYDYTMLEAKYKSRIEGVDDVD